MCIILDNSNGKKIPEYIIDNCIEINKHGFAFYDIKSEKLTKTMDKKKMELLMKQKIPYLAHCRFATQGKICENNIHFFESGDWIIAMNGTIRGLQDTKTNDTKQVVEMLKLVKPEEIPKFLKFFEARFLLYNRITKKKIRTGAWIKYHGVYYSKNNVLDKDIYNKRHVPSIKNYTSHYDNNNFVSKNHNSTNLTRYNHSDKYFKKINQNKIPHTKENEFLVWNVDKWVVKKFNQGQNNSSKTKYNQSTCLIGVYDNLRRGKRYTDILIDHNAVYKFSGYTNAKFNTYSDNNEYYVEWPPKITGIHVPVEVFEVPIEDYTSLKETLEIDSKEVLQFINLENQAGGKLVSIFLYPSEFFENNTNKYMKVSHII